MTLLHTLQAQRARRMWLAAALLTISMLALAGCGGSTNSSTARIRAVNAIPNGGTGTILINSGSANGSQDFGQSSPYLYLNGGTTSFAFALSKYSSPNPAYETITRTLTDGRAYTAVIYGRPDLTTTNDPGYANLSTDPRYPRILLLDDNSSPIPSGSALVRIVNVAPDAGRATSTIGSQQVSLDLSLGASTEYMAVPGGSSSLAITTSSGGTISQPITLTSGMAYTILVTEPTIPTTSTAATYKALVLTDM